MLWSLPGAFAKPKTQPTPPTSSLPAWPTSAAHFVKTAESNLYILDAYQTGLTITGSITLECWAKLGGENTGYYGLMSKAGYGVNIAWYIDLETSNDLHFRSSANGSTGYSSKVTHTLYYDWHHYALTWDQATNSGSWYYDGQKVSASFDITPAAFYASTASFTIGMRNDNKASPYAFTGSISMVRVWNITRTAQEIADNYGKTLYGNETGLVGYWPLDDTFDDGPNGNDLTGSNVTFRNDVPVQL